MKRAEITRREFAGAAAVTVVGAANTIQAATNEPDGQDFPPFGDWQPTRLRGCRGVCRECRQGCSSEVQTELSHVWNGLEWDCNDQVADLTSIASTLRRICHNGDFPQLLHARLAKRSVSMPESRAVMHAVTMAALESLTIAFSERNAEEVAQIIDENPEYVLWRPDGTLLDEERTTEMA